VNGVVPMTSKRYLLADLYDLSRGDSKEGRRPRGVSRHEGEELLPPANAQDRDDEQPGQGERTEDDADTCRAAALDRAQTGEDPDGDRVTTYGPSTGVATSRPSTALSTDMAGVIIPSP
jgi:hypothetical protein